MSGPTVRPALAADEAPLLAIDRATWNSTTTPAPPPPGDSRPFFDESCRPEDVLVAELDGHVAGYIRVRPGDPPGAGDHVAHISGLAVAPGFQRQGVGRALVDAAISAARARRARRMTLRVLGHNEAALRLYESNGFVVEGVLRGEFFLDGAYVDDVLMAFDLVPAVS